MAEVKVDPRVEAYKMLAGRDMSWREVRQGLVGLGVKDLQAKRVAKEVKAELRKKGR